MPSRGQWCGASGLRSEHPEDLLQCHNAGTEGVTIVLDDADQFANQRFGLFVGEFEGPIPERGVVNQQPLVTRPGRAGAG
jgi:hypothetical protein